MSSDLVTMDTRSTKSTTARENAIVCLLNGNATPEQLALFPCPPDALRKFAEDFKRKYPTAGSSKRIGGMGKHHDLQTVLSALPSLRQELKVTNKNHSPLDIITWKPWLDTVQFLQGQIKSKLVQRFIGDCGNLMLREWFDKNIKPFSTNIPGTQGITFEGYSKAMSTIGMKGKQEPAAVAFINALRSNVSLKSALHDQWLSFEVAWFTTHTLNHSLFMEVIKEVIEEKDAWICVSKDAVNHIDGLKVRSLRYISAKQKPHGGMTFHYILTLSRNGETKDVPIECKFHWKNGGQAVQNLNIMVQ